MLPQRVAQCAREAFSARGACLVSRAASVAAQASGQHGTAGATTGKIRRFYKRVHVEQAPTEVREQNHAR